MSGYRLLTVGECIKKLLEVEKPLVVMHVRPDGDTVGSGIALIRILKALGKNAPFICSDKIPERLGFIIGEEKMLDDGDDFTEYEAIAIDVASPAQLGELNGKIKPYLMIDHHEVGYPFADSYIIPGASSAAEVLMTLAEELVTGGKLELECGIASALYTAMCSDTGGFVFSNTSPATMRRAAALMEIGVDHAAINHALFHSKTKEQIRAEGFAAANIKTAFDGKVAYVTVSRADRESLGIPWEYFETAIDVARSVRGAEIAFVIKELDSAIKVSLRSTGKDVASIAASFGGGGHLRAAGCSIAAKDSDEAEELLLSKIKELNI